MYSAFLSAAVLFTPASGGDVPYIAQRPVRPAGRWVGTMEMKGGREVWRVIVEFADGCIDIRSPDWNGHLSCGFDTTTAPWGFNMVWDPTKPRRRFGVARMSGDLLELSLGYDYIATEFDSKGGRWYFRLRRRPQ